MQAQTHTCTTCVICMTGTPDTVLNGCQHVLCAQCLESWLTGCGRQILFNQTCPFCRAPYRGHVTLLRRTLEMLGVPHSGAINLPWHLQVLSHDHLRTARPANLRIFRIRGQGRRLNIVAVEAEDSFQFSPLSDWSIHSINDSDEYF
jgi:hypothetical protein